MSESNAYGNTIFCSSIVLLVMGCAALMLSVLFYLRLRSMGKLQINPSIAVFNRTFNVFDPYPERRKMLHGFLSFLPIFVIAGSLVLAGFAMTTVIEMGLLLGLILFIIGMNLIVLEEAFDVYRGAGSLIKAIKDNLPFGKGDLDFFHIVKSSIPRLIIYYASLSAVFFISSFTLPYLIPIALLSFSQILSVFEVASPSSTLTIFSPYLMIFFFAVVVVSIQIVVRKVRRKIVGFG